MADAPRDGVRASGCMRARSEPLPTRWGLRFGLVLVALAASVAMVSSCEVLVGIPDVELAKDASSPTAEAGDAGESVDSAGCGRTAADGAPRAGPDMVRIDSLLGSYCIDTTEVTVAQFNAYLLDAGVLVDVPAICSGALPLPVVDNAPADQSLPVGQLGACHAWSYCRWAGKRLCGAIGDGGSIYGVRPQDTEWIYACVNGQNNYAYPYGGETDDASACNTDDSDGGPVPVKSRSGCHGVTAPYDQIYDMVGNVWEFVNDLEGNQGNVAVHGGAWTDGTADFGTTGGCLFQTGLNGLVYDDVQSGFRCCADP